ncbi:rolling circle replication-associated protein, partial [Escherichia coli]|uniref:rolling circle replication-associated protein n=1 Tax=Escherichia coli TaxID=562 RepID=UPI001960D0A8
YASRVRERVAPLLELDLPPGNRSENRTRLLFITLTYDVKLKSPSGAWVSISEEFNRWIAGLRGRFGRVSYFKVFEATSRGYPHLHLLLVFHDAEFPFF